jgi:tetratricopeptide (TPR) repeat protein
MTDSNILDTEELFHLAIEAANNNETDKAIQYLKKSLETSPDNGAALYLLGAMHAEIGMYERAIAEMTRAVEIQPDLYTGHFQLGLLHITSGNIEAAKQTWSALDELGDQNPLYLFKAGLLALSENEFDACIEQLEQGISLNKENEALNNDMLRVIEDAKKAKQSAQDDDDNDDDASGSNILLSAYQRNEFDQNH